jgi:hypothetical protein
MWIRKEIQAVLWKNYAPLKLRQSPMSSPVVSMASKIPWAVTRHELDQTPATCPMRSIFTVHTGEFIVGEHLKNVNI